MSDIPAIRRQLNIKAGIVKRLHKDNVTYQKETEQQKQKLDKFIAQGAEDWDIKNGTRMLEESNKMVNDSATRLGKATGELRDLIVAAKKIEELSQAEELVKAQEILEQASV
ncbi:tubulin binding cofactor A [Crucibulum laeve]|uniref:Tubulin-specific chaperone A n=1 Tax=Crucibulum laeve TaxID=68775 RepID=A0A5C3ML88_9AGAR|nr:tubulin binding cofactor A [Crucibulum laeve]